MIKGLLGRKICETAITVARCYFGPTLLSLANTVARINLDHHYCSSPLLQPTITAARFALARCYYSPLLLHTAVTDYRCYCTPLLIHTAVTANRCYCTPLLLHTAVPRYYWSPSCRSKINAWLFMISLQLSRLLFHFLYFLRNIKKARMLCVLSISFC